MLPDLIDIYIDVKHSYNPILIIKMELRTSLIYSALKKSFYTTCCIAAIIFLSAFAFTSFQKMHNWSGCLPALALASVIFGAMMSVTGSSLASWWHNLTLKDESAVKKMS